MEALTPVWMWAAEQCLFCLYSMPQMQHRMGQEAPAQLSLHHEGRSQKKGKKQERHKVKRFSTAACRCPMCSSSCLRSLDSVMTYLHLCRWSFCQAQYNPGLLQSLFRNFPQANSRDKGKLLFKLIFREEISHRLMAIKENIIWWLRKPLIWFSNRAGLGRTATSPPGNPGCTSTFLTVPLSFSKASGTQRGNQRQHAENGKLQPPKNYESLKMVKQCPLSKCGWWSWHSSYQRGTWSSLVQQHEAASCADEILSLNFFQDAFATSFSLSLWKTGREKQPGAAVTWTRDTTGCSKRKAAHWQKLKAVCF